MTAKYATLRFFSDLSDLAPAADRHGETSVTFDRTRSVKDAIESCGVPHTEVGLLLVNGESVGFGHHLADGDRVGVYPPFAALEVEAVSKVAPPPLDPPRFVCDVHLGRLAERLRLLGFDTRYDNDADDAGLAATAADQDRWLLTRDRGLLMRSVVTHGYLPRSDDPTEQAVEVVRRFDLAGDLGDDPRCIACNGRLRAVDKGDVIDELQPGTRRDHDEFVRCVDCAKIYWEGSHAASLGDFVTEVRARTAPAEAPSE